MLLKQVGTAAVVLALLAAAVAYDDVDRLVDEYLDANPGARDLLRRRLHGEQQTPAPTRHRRSFITDALGSLSSLLLGPDASDEPVATTASLVQRLNQMDRLQCVPRMLCSAVAGAIAPRPTVQPPTAGPSVVGPPSPPVISPPAPPTGGFIAPPAPPPPSSSFSRPGQQRPFSVFNAAGPPVRGRARAASRTQPRRHGVTAWPPPRRTRHHRQKRFTQAVNSLLSAVDGMVRPFSFYPYSHAVLMGGMTESRERCAQLYRLCPTDRDSFINVFNNLNRYFPGGMQAFLPEFDIPALDAFRPG